MPSFVTLPEWFVFPPALFLWIGALLLLTTRGFVRDVVSVVAPALTLVSIWLLPKTGVLTVPVAGFELTLYSLQSYGFIFANIFTIVTLVGSIYSLKAAKASELSAAFISAAAALGLVYAGDVLSFFIHWELLMLGSLGIIWSSKQPGAQAAGLRYAYLHLFGGVVLLIGMLMHIHITGNTGLPSMELTLNGLYDIFNGEAEAKIVAYWLMFIGIGINLAAPLFSAWLPDSYPEASPYGAVFLSAFTTKAAVFTLLTWAAGNGLLVFIGLYMIFYGIIYAMLENDMRRILSYSIVNQVGFMVVGIGLGTPLALAGVATHAFCHIIYKALLFMSAGAVLKQTGKRKCTDLGGLYKYMPYTAFCAIIGALSISAFPYTSGFVSKSLISAASADQGLSGVWFLLLAASAGVFLHAGVKFPWFVFYNREDNPIKPDEAPWAMRLGMTIMVALCLLPGLLPQYLYMLLPEMPAYEPYTPDHIITQVQLLLFAGLAFFLALPWLKRTETISLDIDWFYRVLGKHVLLLGEKLVISFAEFFTELDRRILEKIHYRILRLHAPSGILAGHWLIGTTTLLLAGLLAAFLLYYYIRG